MRGFDWFILLLNWYLFLLLFFLFLALIGRVHIVIPGYDDFLDIQCLFLGILLLAVNLFAFALLFDCGQTTGSLLFQVVNEGLLLVPDVLLEGLVP